LKDLKHHELLEFGERKEANTTAKLEKQRWNRGNKQLCRFLWY